MYDSEEIEKLIQNCLKEIELARSQKYDADNADRTAALCLEVQLKLSYFMEGMDLEARVSKNEISRVESEKYHEYKTGSNSDKKITESALTASIAKDPAVVAAKQSHAEAEVKFKRFNFILNTLKDAHIYFRTLGKNNTSKWNE